MYFFVVHAFISYLHKASGYRARQLARGKKSPQLKAFKPCLEIGNPSLCIHSKGIN